MNYFYPLVVSVQENNNESFITNYVNKGNSMKCLTSLICLMTLALPIMGHAQESFSDDQASIKSITLNEDITFKPRDNSTSSTWVHLRNGKVDSTGFKDFFRKLHISSFIVDTSYDSHGMPECTLIVDYDNKLLTSQLVLKKGSTIVFNENSILNLYTTEDAVLLCSGSSKDVTSSQILSEKNLKQIFGDLITVSFE